MIGDNWNRLPLCMNRAFPPMKLLERHGEDGHRVKATVADGGRESLAPDVRDHEQAAEGSELFTDALASYSGLGADYIHQVIDHAESYAEGNVHTNGLENFWSLLKRGIRGTYVSVDLFHLFRYLDEQVFRLNNRKLTDGLRFLRAAAGIIGKRLTYAELIGAETGK